MSMGKEGLLSVYPKNKRFCNLGVCPAFKMTESDLKYLEEASALLREYDGDMDRVVAEIGVPSGHCKATGHEVGVNSPCSATDDQFVNVFTR